MHLRKNGSSRENNSRRSVENSAKTLLANIRFMSVDNPIRTVVITSTIPNEGKTFVAANLARAMATSGVRTLLVECDMRRRSMARTLKTHAQHGVYSVLSGETELKDAIVQTNTPRMDFLDAEPHIPNPSDLLSSKRYTRLIEEAKRMYGYIVFDTPPVGTFVDAAVLGSKVDAVFMVVREQFTRKDEVVRAANQLKAGNVPLAGIVMNYCERQSNEYYYEYYYREDRGAHSSGPSMPTKFPAGFGVGSDSEDDATSGVASVTKDEGVTPKSWSNAPDLDEDELAEQTRQDEEGADDKVSRRSIGGRHAKKEANASEPTSDETSKLSREEIDARKQ